MAGNSVEFKYKQTPYGVKIYRDKGTIPNALKGVFTNETEARKKVTLFQTPTIKVDKPKSKLKVKQDADRTQLDSERAVS